MGILRFGGPDFELRRNKSGSAEIKKKKNKKKKNKKQKNKNKMKKMDEQKEKAQSDPVSQFQKHHKLL